MWGRVDSTNHSRDICLKRTPQSIWIHCRQQCHHKRFTMQIWPCDYRLILDYGPTDHKMILMFSNLKPWKNLSICVAHRHPGPLSPNYLAKFKNSYAFIVSAVQSHLLPSTARLAIPPLCVELWNAGLFRARFSKQLTTEIQSKQKRIWQWLNEVGPLADSKWQSCKLVSVEAEWGRTWVIIHHLLPHHTFSNPWYTFIWF